MTITLTPGQERAIQAAIESGALRSMDEFIDTAIAALTHTDETGSGLSREEAVRRMEEFGEKYKLEMGEPITRKLLHEGRRH